MEFSGSEESDAQLPRTIDEVVTLVLSRMPETTKSFLCRFDEEAELFLQLAKDFSAGMSVRALLGLWERNPDLLAQFPAWAKHPDSASSFILVECWRRLRSETPDAEPDAAHRLRE